ncbi:MAG: phospholipid carrier-dependent glycosyltransferase [Timaviella obliquedivisa GSE-PSE-MK23-08B]|jgi:dolichyl-phosphate-mannose--protein O-mannosyl transferase|nr:phospholipid carrier-dependent glycosyltransferase [Timaviella obliquedivisa GSE-PSE-MK23-08B]
MPSIVPKTQTVKHFSPLQTWFWLGMAGVLFISLALRFWGLERFNALVFDEVYYAKFASNFLKRENIFTGHPPLSSYIIAFGIWASEKMQWGTVKNELAGLLLSPFSYRWLNALTGAFIPLWVGAIAYQLTHRHRFALLAALFIAADGLFLVESRYALNNIYLITFGLLGQLCFLLALRAQSWQRWGWLAVSGAGFGAATAIKWNGLGFLLGAYGVWAIGWILHWFGSFWRAKENGDRHEISKKVRSLADPSPLENLSQIHLGHVLINFALIPALIYYISWIPYIQIDPSTGFWDLQRQTLDYHERVGGLTAHPYCSYWYTWPLMLRPIAYFYQIVKSPSTGAQVIYDVHAMGNPFLWWLSTAAIAVCLALMVQRFWLGLIAWQNASSSALRTLPQLGIRGWAIIYLLTNWAANLLPWVRVTRCLFLYHYMESLIFAVLAIALLVDHWLQSSQSWRNMTATTVICLILIAFIFWMPLYLGLPLSPMEIQIRRWLTSWV